MEYESFLEYIIDQLHPGKSQKKEDCITKFRNSLFLETPPELLSMLRNSVNPYHYAHTVWIYQKRKYSLFLLLLFVFLLLGCSRLGFRRLKTSAWRHTCNETLTRWIKWCKEKKKGKQKDQHRRRKGIGWFRIDFLIHFFFCTGMGNTDRISCYILASWKLDWIQTLSTQWETKK